MILVSVCTGAFSNQCHFLSTDFSYKKNILEKVTCRQDHDRETFQDSNYADVIHWWPAICNHWSNPRKGFLERSHSHGQAVGLDDH